ncbi:MAG: hypothetical protein HYT98_01030 [Candidatus Sungbacteria bacterium]|nr:hypothetical protein [Candidatus Sungbacteria bacterium]
MNDVIAAMNLTFHSIADGTFTFRSADHLGWFILSFILLFFCVGTYFTAYARTAKQKRRPCFIFVPLVFLLFAFMCFGVSYDAYRTVVILNQTQPVYSIDCVWFNAILAGVYFLITIEEVIRNSTLAIWEKLFVKWP